MCQKELVDGFVQLVCRWGAGGNRAETYRAHTLTLIPEFPDTENSAWSYRSVCSQRQRVDYRLLSDGVAGKFPHDSSVDTIDGEGGG